MFPESNGSKFWSHSLCLQNSDIFQTGMEQRGNSMKMNFDIFQIQKWISQTVRTQKVDEKWGHLSSFLFFSWVMVLKLPKIVHFLQICDHLLKDLIMLFQKVVCFIGSAQQFTRYWGISFKKMLAQQKFNKIHQLQTWISSTL